jgi:GTP cyclohydrolase IA
MGSISERNLMPTYAEERAYELLAAAIPGFEEQFQDGNEHLQDTPKRFARMLHELTDREPLDFHFTTFDNTEKVDEMVILSPIPFYTLCAHHIVPFHGKCHIAYVPDKQMAGLSKFPRAVEYWAKGLWVQENLTTQLADFLEAKLEPLGVAVVMKAEHMCIAMRGAGVADVVSTTSAMRGCFLDPSKQARTEFLSLI